MDHLPNIGDRVLCVGDDERPALARRGVVVGYGFQIIDDPAVVVLEHPEPQVLVLLSAAIDLPDMAVRVIPVHPHNVRPDGE